MIEWRRDPGRRETSKNLKSVQFLVWPPSLSKGIDRREGRNQLQGGRGNNKKTERLYVDTQAGFLPVRDLLGGL